MRTERGRGVSEDDGGNEGGEFARVGRERGRSVNWNDGRSESRDFARVARK